MPDDQGNDNADADASMILAESFGRKTQTDCH